MQQKVYYFSFRELFSYLPWHHQWVPFAHEISSFWNDSVLFPIAAVLSNSFVNSITYFNRIVPWDFRNHWKLFQMKWNGFFFVPDPVKALYLIFSREVWRKMEQYKQVMSKHNNTVLSIVFLPKYVYLPENWRKKPFYDLVSMWLKIYFHVNQLSLHYW